jgi:uncharacterized phage-associated protein
MGTKINEGKYKNAILFFIKYCNNQYLGATKLNKLLYYLDFISFRDNKKPVTDDLYVHKQYGPVPSKIDDVLTDLHEKGFIKISKLELKHNDGDMFRYDTNHEIDLGVFNKYEKDLLGKIVKEFCLWTTDKIVNQTHLEAPWFYSKPYEIVDYKYSNDIEFFASV